MKIIFFGSDDFAETHLQALLHSEHEVVACVTQPDRAKGRGLKLAESPIKQIAVKAKTPMLQPESLKDFQFMHTLKNFQPDLFIVVAYGKILPIEVLSIPYICCMNVHGSLLPKYRGAAPINWAIINGEKETGISIIKMNSAMDAGDIFTQASLPILDVDNAMTLREKLAMLGAKILIKTIDSLEKNDYTLTVQDKNQVTLAPKLTKNLGAIDWAESALKIHNLIRGLLPWPGAETLCQGKVLKILESRPTQDPADNYQSGEIIKIAKDGILVATGEKSLFITKVHPESSKAMDAASFIAGQRVSAGLILGR